MLKRSIITKISFCLLLTFFLLPSFYQAAADSLVTISPVQAADLIVDHKDNSDFVIIDVRTPDEFKTGHLENAILIDFFAKDYLAQFKHLDKSKIYLIYCRSGNRSGKTLGLIEDMGFERIYNIGTGIIGWQEKGFKVVR